MPKWYFFPDEDYTERILVLYAYKDFLYIKRASRENIKDSVFFIMPCDIIRKYCNKLYLFHVAQFSLRMLAVLRKVCDGEFLYETEEVMG